MCSSHPPFDDELGTALRAMRTSGAGSVTLESIGQMRGAQPASPDPYLAGGHLIHHDRVFPGRDGSELTVAVFRRRAGGHGPGIFYIHGGGMISGNRFTGLAPVIEWAERFDAVVMSVEYRLAPEHPYPVPFEDCYAGLGWAIENVRELGYDPDRLIIAGTSAGGGLAAGVALRMRDEGRRSLAGQLLICPMLDDRDATVSTRQIDGIGLWDRDSNITGWRAYLGDLRQSGEVPGYAAPARASDLSGLPPAYLDAGSSEVFRDEIVAYASGLWAAGGQAELHVWPGGFHGFDKFVPDAALSRVAIETRTQWFRRTFAV
jgi:acetyl esterase/lipase